MALRRRVTIAEVAREAGVSKTTVSVVLNGSAAAVGIRPATQAAILDTMARLGYTPNHAARSLRRRSTSVLTLLVQDLANPCFTDIAVAARAAAEANGYTLNVVGAGPADAELKALEHLRGGSSDAVIVATGRHGERPRAIEVLLDLVRHGVPAVILLDRSPDPLVPAIRVDVEAGAHLATSHLLGLGHRQIAHLALQGARPLDAEQNSQGDRYRGYRRAMEDAGHAVDPRLVIRGGDTPHGGRALLRSLFEADGPRPTAILVYNDLMAVGVLRGLYELGLRVPDDVAVVGTDGIELGEYLNPSLTTVDHPRAELGRLAVETVRDFLDGSRPVATERVLPTGLIVRESCGARRAPPT
ncbi:MAG TPA: LacI family DNA-binding transcriptional regulator [Chloroflexota bacterium]|nr:LacI family DNA-binding transcriptional regulator [Chloroflexota bacterium]